ncbi:hypothetical protein J6O48_10070 [bacterium]|nr:hypothetical protein [bacterium]
MKNKYLKYIYALIIFYLVWLIFIPLGFRLIIKPVLNLIKPIANVEIIRPRLHTGILPNIKFKADKITLLNKDNSSAFEITKPKLNVRIIPFLAGKVHINSFEGVNIDAKLNLKDKLYLGDYPILIPEKKIDLKINRIKIKKLDIMLDETNSKHVLSGDNLYFKTTRRAFVCSGKSALKSNQNTAFINYNVNFPRYKNLRNTKFDINVLNLNLQPFSNLISNLTNNEVTSMFGTINLSSNNKNLTANLDKIKICFKDKYRDIILPETFKIESKHKIKENGFKIKTLTADGKNIHASLKGEIKSIFSQKPFFNLQVDIKPSDMRAGALMLPPIITPDINIPKLKQYPFYADISGKMKIKGKFPEPDITGDIKVTNGVLIRPIPNTTKGADINIKFIGKQLLLDVVVPAGGKEVVYVSGDIMVYGDKYAHLKVKSSQNVNLGVAEFALNPIHEVFCFMLGPVPIMDINGLGNVDIRIEGTKKDPHIWGDFNFKNTSARFLEINNMVLERANGNLNFNDQNAHFKNDTGILHGKKVTVDGVCTLFGDLDFNVTANNQNLNDLYKILTTSPMLKDIKSIVPVLTNIKGSSDFFLNLKGKLLDINDLKINENVLPKGFIKLLGNSVNIENLTVKNLKGQINFNKKDCDFDLNGNLSSGSKSTIIGFIKDNIADIDINTPKLYVNDLSPKSFKFLDPLYVKLKAHYKGPLNEIEIGGIDAIIDILHDFKPVKNSKINSGKILLKNSNLNISNLKGKIKQNPFNVNLRADNIGNKKLNLTNAKINGNINCKSFDLTAINAIIQANIMSYDIQKELNKLYFKSGTADIWAKIRNSRTDATINIHPAKMNYLLYKNTKKENVITPINLISGQITIRNNLLKLNKINTLVDEMPVLLYGEIKNIYQNPQYNIKLHSKLMQKTFDKYWNSYNIYPIKTNGDILYYANILGNKTRTKIKSDVKIEANSSIYYMGATIGDSINPITVNIDADIDKTGWIKLNKFKYNKLISSQNHKQTILPLVSMHGQLKNLGKIFEFHNFIIKTENPTNANLFNIIFKKPTIKQGYFTSNLKMNGRSDRPKIIGKLDVNNLEMPYLNTTVKGLNINFKPDVITLTTKGTVLDNYIMGNINIKNNLVPPYRINNADIYINDLNIDSSMNQLKQLELKGISSAISTDIDTSGTTLIHSILLNNVKIRAGIVRIRNIKASNLIANCSMNEKMQLSVDKFKFNMASGTISGKIKYNLLNNLTNMELNANKVNANELSIALFDLPNQIFGSLTGAIELNFKATNDTTRLSTLSGYGTFNVSKGRMPKLGSLEYLLRAGNLIKGGITSLSMNGIIDIITPMKTGEFSGIKGRLRIKDGIAKTVEIQTIGKNLNLYMAGSLNLSNQNADMHVYGQLSRKISTILGAAGNISLNTLFNKIPWISLDNNSPLINDLNKIPGIELSNKSTRRFMVEILGDINGENFVKSFKWIN